MFEIKDAKGGYNQHNIIKDINFNIEKGEKVALLGRNGVGKTTLIKYIMGLLNYCFGEIKVGGKSINIKQPTIRAGLGIGFVPQGRFVFEKLSVRENIVAVALANKKNVNKSIKEVFEIFPILVDHSNRKAESLSGGQQQILAIARALVIEPKIIILDEPSEGIQPSIIHNIADTLNKLNKEKNMSLLIAEQNLDFCMSITDRALIMDQGTIVKNIPNQELKNNQTLLKELLAV